MDTLFCPWAAPHLVIFSDNIPSFFFYSHIPAMLIAVAIGLMVFLSNRKSAIARTLLLITVLFFLWSFFDLILWATNKPSDVIFFWSFQILVETLVFYASIYLTYLFVRKKDMPIKYKMILAALLLPTIILLPTAYNLVGVNLVDCTAIENFMAVYYTYILEGISIIAITGIVTRGHMLTRVRSEKKEINAFGLGIILFLVAFLWGNVIGSFTDNWALAQAGLIGMPVFVAILAYLIVRYKAFNVRLIAAQTLVYALELLTLSLLLIRDFNNIRIVVVFTAILIAVVGNNLVKSVRREIQQRERLEKLRLQLEDSNERLKDLDKLKTEFLSLASHQLRSPLTAIKGYTSMLLEESFGKLLPSQKEAIDRVYQSSQHLTKVVEDLLNVSKIEQGGMKYQMEEFDFEKAARDLEEDLSITAKNKGLSLTFTTDAAGPYLIMGDMEKLRQVILNMIDNAIKYTDAGSITVHLSKTKSAVQLAITDTGMGIAPEEKEKLFQKFSRGAGGKTNTGGSGLGLYLAKEIVEAHKGHILIDSSGVGKGSTFTIELPLK